MSGIVIKTGIYGMARVFFDFYGDLPVWAGMLVLLVGVVSALLGVLYALMEHDLKRLLAYHSIENIGTIQMGFGSALLFRSFGHPNLAALALMPLANAQLVYTTNSGTTGTVAIGVQHPYEIYPMGIEEAEEQILLTVFPNPAKDFLTLKVENPDNENLFYQLYDNSGKLLATKKLRGNEIRIDMSSLIPATYFLKVKDNNKDVKTFKIVKN